MTPAPQQYARLTLYAGWAATSVALLLLGIKLFAFMVTGSSSMLAAMTDSLLDLLASIINLVAIRIAIRPPDQEHRFGHGKAEAIAGLAQSAFIAGSSTLLIFHSLDRISHPQPLNQPEVGGIVIIISIVMTLFLVMFQRYVYRKTGSLAVLSDSLHYRSDLLMNVAILIAMYLAWQGQPQWDGWFALAIAFYILVSAYKILRQAIDVLMDKGLDENELEQIQQLIMQDDRVYGFHQLKTRRSGPVLFIQFHLELNDELSLMNAHAIGDEVEDRLRQHYPDADILIHIDPQSLREDQRR